MTLRRAWRSLTTAAMLLALTGAAACDGAQESEAAPSGTQPVAQTALASDAPVVTVYKTPTCGCCTKWVDHLKASGFRVESHDITDVSPIKAEHGVPGNLHSCHTAVVDGYVVEGHIPADVVRKLLAERPQVAGIAVPGMPMGSPGMEGPYTQNYDVLAFTREGEKRVYSKH